MNAKVVFITLVMLFTWSLTKGQSHANCNKLFLDTSTFYISYLDDSIATGNLYYKDTNMAVYPVLHLILADTSLITSPGQMVLSLLGYPYDTVEYFHFDIHFKTHSFPANTIVNGLFHIYDSDIPGDSIVSCYLPITFILQHNTGINEGAGTNENISLYPNPAEGQLTVQSGSNEPLTEISVADITGRQVLLQQPNTDRHTFSLAGLSRGVYCVSIKTASGQAYRKLVKQ